VIRILNSRLVRLAIAAGLTGYLFWKYNPAEIGRATLSASPSWLLAACALVLADRALMAWRWLVLLRPLTADAPPPFGAVMRVFFVSTFVGTFLPASVGGDAVRAFSLSRYDVPTTSAIASVVMDRALGVVSILVLGAASLALLSAPVPHGVYAVIAIGALASAVLAAIIFSDAIASLVATVVDRVPGAPVRRILHKLLEAVRAYRHHHGVLANVLASSVAVQALRVLQAWCLGQSLGITAGVALYFVTIPVILLIMLLPVTVNGFGTGQAAFLWTFGAAGVAGPPALALSVLFIALGIVGNLPGGLLYVVGGGRPRSAAQLGSHTTRLVP
jgi:glycosyltransferase 2 family protein